MWKNNSKRKTLFILLLLSLAYSFSPFIVQASEEIRNVRVGFFKFSGYHNIDSEGNRSGYGYEYLHTMAKYTGWNFTYVSGTWEECQEMLKNGEIDLLTSAHHTEEREQNFDFSTLPIGESYTQLTVKNDNPHFTRNDFKSFNNMTIGILKGNSRNALLEPFAQEKGFSYHSTEYAYADDLNQALQNGTVDAVLTSSLRKLSGERVIAQFVPASFYCIVKKGNTQLLSEINTALEKINIENPAYKGTLYNKYYRANVSTRLSLTEEQKIYLKNHPTLRVVGPPEAYPLFFYQDGIAKGIVADIFALLVKDLGLNVKYLQTENYLQAIQMVGNGEADVINLFQDDFNWAEQNNIKITSPYILMRYSAVTQAQFSGEFKRIAAINGSHIFERYIVPTYKNATLIAVDTEEDAIRAVMDEKVDVAFINAYSAQALLLPKYFNLKAVTLADTQSNTFSLGIGKSVSPILYALLDSKVGSLDQATISQIVTDHTLLQKYKLTLLQYMKLNSEISSLVIIGIFLSIITGLIYLVLSNKRHDEKVFKLAYYDDLTKLWNMNGFDLKTKNKLAEKNKSTNHAIIVLDIEAFSYINDDYGRDIGNLVLVEIAEHLRRFCGDSAILAHSHADHYLLYLEYKTPHDFDSILKDICSLTHVYTKNNFSVKFNMRLGVYQIEAMDKPSFYTALDRAKVVHQIAKKRSCPIVYFDEALEARLKHEKSIIDYFGRALEAGEFVVYYQPKFDMRNGNLVGAEALIRWIHKDLGFLPPVEFIPLLEKTGDVVEIDFFVLEQACILIRNWLDTGHAIIPVSVNQSRVNFQKSEYIDRLQGLLVKYDIPRNLIELEITESLFENQNVTPEIIEKIKMLGLSISVDDFGSGYSSLYLLNKVSIDTLKIDKSLINDSETLIKVRKILRKIVEMAYDLDLEVICEGVENQEQINFLLEIGCKYAQGFFYSKPVCEEEFIALLNP